MTAEKHKHYEVKGELHCGRWGHPVAPAHPASWPGERSPPGCHRGEESHWPTGGPYPPVKGTCGWMCRWRFRRQVPEGEDARRFKRRTELRRPSERVKQRGEKRWWKERSSSASKWEEQQGQERCEGEKSGWEPVKERGEEASAAQQREQKSMNADCFSLETFCAVTFLLFCFERFVDFCQFACWSLLKWSSSTTAEALLVNEKTLYCLIICSGTASTDISFSNPWFSHWFLAWNLKK